ncbi:MAG: glycosyltransferase, partial [Deltaproteobacteria bacterium]|nr:glycosyltransferase [Deltaproteobacteria bacterium]
MLTPTYPGGNVTVSCRHDGGLCERVITHLLPKENEIVGLGAQTHEEVLAIPRVRICRLLLGASQTTGPYNLLCLPPEPGHDMTLCVLFRPTVIVPQTLRCFHGNGSIVGFLGALKRAFRSRDQGFDLVHAHSTHVAVLYLLFSWFCGTSRIPTVFTLHTSYGNLDLKHKLMLIPILFWFSRVVFCSHASRDSLPRFLLRLTGNRSRVVTNGVDLARVDSTLNQMDISEHKDG